MKKLSQEDLQLDDQMIVLDDYNPQKKIKVSLHLANDPFNDEKEKKHYKRLKKCLELEKETKKVNFVPHFNALKTIYSFLFASEKINKLFVHFDLDMFYAQVEMLRSGNTFPLGIGGTSMLAATNYLAREYGVKAGMPGYIGKQLCPHLVIIKPDFQRINFYSDTIMSLLSIFDNEIEIYGIDEACLSFTPEKLQKAEKEIEKINLKEEKIKINFTQKNELYEINKEFVDRVFILVNQFRKYVYKKTCLTISAGMSLTRGLAKYASGINKPNNQSFVTDYDINLEVDEINGIGNATKEILFKINKIKTIQELREKKEEIFSKFTEKTALSLLYLSYGVGYFDFRSQKKSHNKGISKSFASTSDYDYICDTLFYLCDKLFVKIKNTICSTLTLKIRFASFKSVTKSVKLGKVIKVEDLFNKSIKLLFTENKLILPEKINQLGISVSDLKKDTPLQLKNVNAIERECPICNCLFYHESEIMVQTHVEVCINRKKKKESMTLDKYFKKKSN